MTEDRLQEVIETDAPPAVARIYREICEATGLPFVNLAWRHMAALPGVLPWVWDIVGQAYRSGEVAQAAAGLRAAAAELTLEPLRGDELARAGLDGPARQVLAELLEAYNRGNTQNLIGWSALLRSAIFVATEMRSGKRRVSRRSSGPRCRRCRHCRHCPGGMTWTRRAPPSSSACPLDTRAFRPARFPVSTSTSPSGRGSWSRSMCVCTRPSRRGVWPRRLRGSARSRAPRPVVWRRACGAPSGHPLVRPGRRSRSRSRL